MSYNVNSLELIGVLLL